MDNLPDFEHVVTILALAATPLGVWLGWFLSDRTSRKQAQADSEAAAAAAEQQRMLELATLARRLTAEIRGLMSGIYLKHTSRRSLPGLTAAIASFNEARAQYAAAVLAARVLGPTRRAQPAEDLEAEAQFWLEVTMNMQTSLTAGIVDTANERSPVLDTTLSAFTTLLSSQYNPSHEELPTRPDLYEIARQGREVQ